VDLATDDQRAWTLAPHLVLLDSGVGRTDSTVWLNPETGTSCLLEPSGEYVVMRRNGERYTPVVAGQVPADDTAELRRNPDSTRSRRAVALAIVAVDHTAHA
jgi:hypothetical protein